MRALVIGAGAVGQVYGQHLASGGAEVGFLVKPEHAEETRAGFTLYPLNRRRRRRGDPERFTGYTVYASIPDAAREHWDQVYLAMSSTALRDGSWLAELALRIGGATIVLLQPGPEDRDFLLRHVPEDRVVQGIITLIGYRAPLPGEARFPAPGVAYWFPPLSPSPMSGSTARVEAVVAALRGGGLPARKVRDVSTRVHFVVAFMMPVFAVLESVGWRFHRFRQSEHLALALRASREAMDVVAHTRAQRPPLALRLVARPIFVRALLRLAPLMVPFDLESYLQAHFTKVGDQTRDFLRSYLAWGRSGGIRIDALERVSPE